MKKTRLILVIALAGVLTVAAGGAAAWWGLRARAAHDGPDAATASASAPAKVDKRPQKYVNLDKVIVMLRREDGDNGAIHYLAMDLVLKTPEPEEKVTKEHLPMLRSVALKALSGFTAEKAGAMTIDQFAEVINTAYAETYAHDQREKPFSEAMIGKLIIE